MNMRATQNRIRIFRRAGVGGFQAVPVPSKWMSPVGVWVAFQAMMQPA